MGRPILSSALLALGLGMSGSLRCDVLSDPASENPARSVCVSLLAPRGRRSCGLSQGDVVADYGGVPQDWS